MKIPWYQMFLTTIVCVVIGLTRGDWVLAFYFFLVLIYVDIGLAGRQRIE